MGTEPFVYDARACGYSGGIIGGTVAYTDILINKLLL
jgi:hypothetical protein